MIDEKISLDRTIHIANSVSRNHIHLVESGISFSFIEIIKNICLDNVHSIEHAHNCCAAIADENSANQQ